MSWPGLDELYREVVLDHYKNPRGQKRLEAPQICNAGVNPTCGDEVMVKVLMKDDVIEDVEVNSRGCSISVASGSMLAEALVGKTLGEAMDLSESFRQMMHGDVTPDDVDMGDLEALYGVRKFPVRIKCALLPWTTLSDAMKNFDGKAAPLPSTTELPGAGGRPSLTPDQGKRSEP